VPRASRIGYVVYLRETDYLPLIISDAGRGSRVKRKGINFERQRPNKHEAK